MSSDLTPASDVPHEKRASDSVPVTVSIVFQWAIVVGVTTGLIEASARGLQRRIWGRLLHTGDDFYWLSPLMNLMIFLAVAVGVAIAVKIMPRRFSFRFVPWTFLFIGVIGLRGLAPRIHAGAWLLVSAGVATVLSESLILRSDRGVKRLRRAACAGGIVCALLVAAGIGYESTAERRANANLPSASPGDPNLLWIVLDTVPSKRMSLYGYHKPTTPGIEAFANEGVVFDRCISTSPWTLPSHATMFTGTMPRQQSGRWTAPLDDSLPILSEVLRQRGYFTAGFVANTYFGSTEFGLNRGFGRYREPRTWLLQAIGSSQLAESLARRSILPIYKRRVIGRKSAADINRECLATMAQRRDEGRPYFAFLNYIDAHEPYMPPDPFDEQYGSPRPRDPYPRTTLLAKRSADVELDRLTRAYEACLTYIDDQVSRLLDEFQSQGLLDNTVVVIIGDHGEQLGENKLMGHGNSLYMPQIHVPLVISFPPRLPAGRRVEALVSTRDLAATVVELLGVPDSPLPGASMVPLMNGAAASRDDFIATAEVFPKPPDRMEQDDYATPLAKGEMRSAVSNEFHYILNGDGREELYQYIDDPEERHDLSTSAQAAKVLDRLRRAVNQP